MKARGWAQSKGRRRLVSGLRKGAALHVGVFRVLFVIVMITSAECLQARTAHGQAPG